MAIVGDTVIFKQPHDLICKFWAVGACAKGQTCTYRHSWSNGDGLSELAKQEQQCRQLKVLHGELLPKKTQVVKLVVWNPPPPTWIKINTDGAARSSTGETSCGGVFRDSTGRILTVFCKSLEVKTALEAEMLGVITAIDYAWTIGWRRIWLECDADQVVKLINNKSSKVSASVKYDWLRVLERVSMMEFMCSHIYREGNKVADLLANHALDNKNHDLGLIGGLMAWIEEEAKLDACGHIRQRVKSK